MHEPVRVETSHSIQAIRFERPEKRNAFTAEMYEAAADALVLGEADLATRVFLLAGTPGAFSIGNDVDEFREFAETGAVGESMLRFLKTLATLDKPIVAAVDGLATGIGAVILMHCDHVVASEWSVISAPFSDRGLLPEGAASLLAPRLMGYKRAFDLLVMGEQLDAHRAWEFGLVNQVVTPEAVEEVAWQAAGAIAMKPPEAVRLARKLLRGDTREIVQRIDAEAGGFADLLRSREARDAFERFLSRRG